MNRCTQFAELYSVWKSPQGEKIPTSTIVTTDPNEPMEGIHDHMPAMLLKEEWAMIRKVSPAGNPGVTLSPG